MPRLRVRNRAWRINAGETGVWREFAPAGPLLLLLQCGCTSPNDHPAHRASHAGATRGVRTRSFADLTPLLCPFYGEIMERASGTSERASE